MRLDHIKSDEKIQPSKEMALERQVRSLLLRSTEGLPVPYRPIGTVLISLYRL
jgi:hypothetical protein